MAVAFSTQRRKLFFTTRCATWPCCETKKTRPFIINLPATKADVSPNVPFFLSSFFPAFSLGSSLLVFLPPSRVFPLRVPSVSQSTSTSLMEFRRMLHAVPSFLSRTFCWRLLVRWKRLARCGATRWSFVLNIKLVEEKNFNDREYVI